jgi:myo-inositol-1(or 4)-monophosphatase
VTGPPQNTPRTPHPAPGDLDPLFLTTAIEAVVRAGDLQMAQFGGHFQIDKKGTIDLVTEVDIAVERMFRALVAERFPDHQVLAEEMGGAATAPAGPCWVFDPIDGTTNFAHGLPIFCSSLALEIDGVAEIAAVYDPTRKELFTAERGGGAFLNGVPLHVSSADRLVDSMLVTGFPYDVHSRVDEIVGLFAAFVGQVRAVRRLGSAAIDLCYVAAGRLDGFWESDLKAWDIAGGALIVAEAGGRITNMAGEPFTSRGGHVLATNGHLHEPMLDVIVKFRQERAPKRTV